MPGLPYEDEFTQLQNEMFGLVGATAGRAIGGEPGAIVGQKLAAGGLRMSITARIEGPPRTEMEARADGYFIFDDPTSTAVTLLQATNAFIPYSLSVEELGERAQIAEGVDRMADLLLRGLTAGALFPPGER